MKKKIIKRIRGIALLLVILAALLFVTSPFLMRKDSQNNFHEFYLYAEQYDVLFLGSSHVLNGVVPMDLWEQHGITSYNMGISGSSMSMNYWALQNALHYASPKLIVLDCAYLQDQQINPDMSYNDSLLDDMRHLPNKFSAVMDLFDSWGDRFRYLFSIYRNHWSELIKGDLASPDSKGLLGFTRMHTIVPVELPDFASVTEPVAIDNVSTVYLRRIIEECQASGIDVLLTYIPFAGSQSTVNEAAFLQTIADEYNLHYLSAAELAAVLEPQVDFANNDEGNSHLNVSGAQRLSRFYGDFIAENYNLRDHRSEAAFQHWDTLRSSYHSDYRSILKHQEDVASYLMSLYHEGYSILIEAAEPYLLKSPVVRDVMENLGADMSRITADTDLILLSNLGRDSAYYEHFWAAPTAQDSFLGHLSLGSDASGHCLLSLDKKTLVTKPNFGTEAGTITFYVLDSNSHKVLNTRTFTAADVLTAEAAALLTAHNQPTIAYAEDLAACTDPAQLYVLPNGHIYSYAVSGNALPEITIESATGGYWYGNEGEPLGAFNQSDDCSAKRTQLIPVTPGDQFVYLGNAKYTPDSVVWLNERQHFISDEKYEAKRDPVSVTAPAKAAYVWFASFAYAPTADDVVLEVDWLYCQAASAAYAWTDTGISLFPAE